MNLIDICIITIIVSLMMRIKAKLEIYKEVSDLGYKFNIEKLEELEQDESIQIDIVTRVLNDYYMYIPFINLLIDAIRETNYYNHKEEQIEMLKRYGALEKMTEDELKEYKDYKTGYHAIKMEKRHLKKLANISMTEFTNGSRIWFDFKEDIDETDSLIDIIEIIEVTGIYKNLSNEELKQKVYYSLMVVGNNILQDEQNKKEEISTEEKRVEEKIIETPLYNQVKETTKPKTRVRKKDK